MNGKGNYAVRWKLRESKSYESWSKIDDFVWVFLVNKALELVERMSRIRGKSLLEICCGSGIEMQYLAKRLSLLAVGLDLSRSMAHKAKLKEEILDVIIGDAESLPLRNYSFDISFVYNGLHHLPDPYLAIRELGRVSRDVIIIIDIVNPLLTKLLNFLGLYRYEGHTQMKPNRLDNKKLRETLRRLNMNYSICYCFGYLPSFARNFMKKIFRKINSCFWRKPLLGIVFANMVIVIGYKQRSTLKRLPNANA